MQALERILHQTGLLRRFCKKWERSPLDEENHQNCSQHHQPDHSDSVSFLLTFPGLLRLTSTPELQCRPTPVLNAIAGLGITRLLSFQVQQEIEQQQQQLTQIFPQQLPPGLAVSALFTHQRNLSPRVWVFLDFLGEYCGRILGGSRGSPRGSG